MTDTEVFEKKESMPLESCSFTYTKEEYREAKKLYFTPITARVIISNIIMVALVVYVLIRGEFDYFGGLMLGVEGMALYFTLKSLLMASKSWKIIEPKVCSSVYSYELFEDCMFLKITREGETVHLNKFEYSDLRQKFDTGKYYLLNLNNQIYVIKKQELAENSLFHSIKPKEPEKPSKGIRAWSKVLMVLSIVAGVSGVICGFALYFAEALHWWYPYIFAIIPIVSFFFGIYMKKNYNGGRGNSLAGFFAALMIFAVFFCSNSWETTDIQKRQQIRSIESYAGVDLPDTRYYESYTDIADGIYYTDTIMQFYNKDVGYLESVIKSDEIWSQTYSADTSELLSEVGAFKDWDFISVYNITTGEYNKVPEDAGTYNMAAMFYYMGDNELCVTEYKYTK